MVSQDFVPLLHAQDADANPPPTAQQLDQLLAPIALYPDALLAQITTACTDPQEILDVDNWLQQNPDLTGTALTDAAQAAGFDPAFIALVNFPQVIAMTAGTSTITPRSVRHFQRTKPRSPIRFSDCALRPMMPEHCAAIQKCRWKCRSPPPARPYT
jgi:hypothetical protein